MKSIYWILSLSLVIKLVLAAWLPLAPDEAYYWVWSHYLQLSYFDHPPFIAWLFSLGHIFEPWGQLVRWPGVIFAHAGALFWIVLLKRYLSRRSLMVWLLLFLLMPLTGPGSLIMTPDVPLLFFWGAAFLCMDRFLERPHIKWAILLGATLGLGFCSKYHIVLFLPLAVIAVVKERPRSLPKLLAGAPVFFALSLPVWVWNAQHDWVSFRFQLQHGLGGGAWEPSWTFSYLLSQILLIFPPVLYMALRGTRQVPFHFSVFAWGPLTFFFLTSFKGHVEANWPVTAYPLILALAVFAATRWRWAYTTALCWLIVLIAALVQVHRPWLPLNPEKLKTSELTAYDKLPARLQDKKPLFARTYQMASKLSFEMKRQVPKLMGMNRTDFYDFQEFSRPNTSQFYVIMKTNESLPQWTKKTYTINKRQTLTPQYELVEVTKR